MNIKTHIYKFTCISLCTHVYIHNHTDIYHQLVFSTLCSLCGTFLFWFFKTHEKISSSYHDSSMGNLTFCHSRQYPHVYINVGTFACIHYTYTDTNTHTLHSHTNNINYKKKSSLCESKSNSVEQYGR